VVAVLGCGGGSEGGSARADWPMYRGDAAGSGYSPLAEITTANVGHLAPAWTYGLASSPAGEGAGDPGRPARSQATPIAVDGVPYLPAASAVVALDAATGEELWRHTVADGAPSRRGVSYWPGGGADGAAPRLVFCAGARLIALDAATGPPSTEFGAGAAVDIGAPSNSLPLGSAASGGSARQAPRPPASAARQRRRRARRSPD